MTDPELEKKRKELIARFLTLSHEEKMAVIAFIEKMERRRNDIQADLAKHTESRMS